MAMNASRVLYNSTEETLDSLGNSTKQMIMWQMSERGIDMAPDNFDINKAAPVLYELFGEGSETVLSMIYRKMCSRLRVNARTDSDLSALEKINKVIEAKKMS